MSDKKSAAETIEDKIKKAAKDVEDFADKVTADEEPVVLVPDTDAPPSRPAGETTKKGS